MQVPSPATWPVSTLANSSILLALATYPFIEAVLANRAGVRLIDLAQLKSRRESIQVRHVSQSSHFN